MAPGLVAMPSFCDDWPMTDNERVEKARERRQALRAGMMQLEATSAAPAARKGWLGELDTALSELVKVFDDHVEMVEGEGGLLDEIEDIAPHLEAGMDQMRTDHREIHTLLDSIRTSIKDSEATPDAAGVIRQQIRSLLSGLAEHRQRGADLVYDAYNVDISAGD